jgi:dihydropyrimidinase
MDILIKNGKVVTSSQTYRADVGIKGGKIVALGASLRAKKGTEVIDARGKYLLPGVIDPHVHCDLPFCGTVSANFFEETASAAAGGITTVIDFAIQTKGKTLKEAVRNRKKLADPQVAVDYSLHVGITDWKNKRTQAELAEVIKGGIPSFKMFMIYRGQGWMSDDADLYEALHAAKKYGGRIGVHAENVYLTEALVARYLKEKKYATYNHALTRPNFTEGEAIQRAITLAEAADGSLYIVHMSTKEGLEAVREARKKGVDVYAETCPQYLFLTDELFKKKNGHWYATCPPIRKKADCLALWQGMEEGMILNMGTDTCTFNSRQKALYKGVFARIPFGMPGLETFLPMMYTAAMKRSWSVNDLVAVTSTNSAKIFGLYPKKGTIAIGSDADVVIFDPKQRVVISPKRLQSTCDWNPYAGAKLKGYPVLTIARGKVVARNGKFVGEKGWGQFVPRKAYGRI